MWKNVFIESCLLSALIFGGIYINANILKKEISSSRDHIQNQPPPQTWMHISGYSGSSYPADGHVSGNNTTATVRSSISGVTQLTAADSK